MYYSLDVTSFNFSTIFIKYGESNHILLSTISKYTVIDKLHPDLKLEYL